MKHWIKTLLFLLCLAGMTAFPLSEADAAISASLEMKGQKHGKVRGSNKAKGREGTMMVIGMSHEMVAPHNAASGLPTGKRQHKPFVVTKPVDKASPLLASMLADNENIPDWELSVYAPRGKGGERVIYRISLTNAAVTKIRLFTDDKGDLYEEVTFTYKKITWLWEDGKIEAEDSWRSGKR